MSEATTVTGTPTLTLLMGLSPVNATFVSGSGTTALVFNYTILANQTDANGISIAANRNPKARAALCHDVTSAKLARQHNDANILALGARLIGIETAFACVEAFLNTSFEGGRHAERVKKLGKC